MAVFVTIQWQDGGEDGTECIKLTKSLGESVQLGKAKKHANFYDMIEKMYTAAKTHRNIIDIEFSEFAVCNKYILQYILVLEYSSQLTRVPSTRVLE